MEELILPAYVIVDALFRRTLRLRLEAGTVCCGHCNGGACCDRGLASGRVWWSDDVAHNGDDSVVHQICTRRHICGEVGKSWTLERPHGIYVFPRGKHSIIVPSSSLCPSQDVSSTNVGPNSSHVISSCRQLHETFGSEERLLVRRVTSAAPNGAEEGTYYPFDQSPLSGCGERRDGGDRVAWILFDVSDFSPEVGVECSSKVARVFDLITPSRAERVSAPDASFAHPRVPSLSLGLSRPALSGAPPPKGDRPRAAACDA